MSIDLKQFYQVFFEEAAEHLQNMEALLLNLDQASPDPEDLDAIFRAAHSIKGGSGTFGFTDMAALTHSLETMLDRMRKFEIHPNAEIVNTLLEGQDVLRAQLDAHRGDGTADPQAAQSVIAHVEALLRDPGAKAAPAATRATPGIDPLPMPVRVQRCFRIELSPLSEPAVREHLLRELGELGTLKLLGRERPDGPETMELATALTRAELEDLFGFAAGQGEFSIAEIEAPVALPEVDPGFGFFDPLPEPQVAADPGYGFFEAAAGVPDSPALAGEASFLRVAPAPEDVRADPAPAAPATEAAQRSPGRRGSDDPEAVPVRAGRRETDKVAVPASESESSIRVSVDKVDQLINLVGELVITQAMLTQTSAKADPTLYEALFDGLVQLERNTRELQEAVMYIRMMPIAFVFRRFPRVVHDLAQKLGKQVELKMVGESTELDKSMIEKIADPLTHLVRNSLDHGLESPERRVAAGKPEKGTITLRAFHEGGSIVVEVIDDGAGLNRERILAKARERGMAVSDNLTDPEVWQLIFEAGFSTADQVTDVSGRGVGMDVVRRNIQAVGGRVEIESRTGQGTTISIRLPLTLAILDGLSVSVTDELFIVPLTYIIESLQPAAKDICSVQGSAQMLHVRGDYIPLIPLHERLGLPASERSFEQGICVIVEAEGRRAALFVDSLLAQHQVVIKSLESNYRKVPGVSGATIMGDGRVALILDVAGLVRLAPQVLARAA